MKIAIDISPLSSGHKIRGIGFYLSNLKDSLTTYFPSHEYIFFDDYKKLSKAFDVIHFPYFDPFFMTLPLKKIGKTVVTVHDLTPIKFREHFPAGFKGNLKWNVQKRILKNVDAILTDSNSSKNDIAEIIKYDSNKIFVAYLAASQDFKPITKKEAEEKLKKFKLPPAFGLYVGDVTWNKNLPRIVEAINRSDIPLVMIGKTLVSEDFDRSNPWNSDLVKVLNSIKDNKKFLRLGFVTNEELNSLYNLATFLLMPSIYEGFGLPVLEAMQAGCPVITSQSGSLEEVAGKAALFVDPMSVSSIKEGIDKLSKDKDLQNSLREKGLNQAKDFSWRETARKTLEVYEKVAGKY